MLLTPRDMLLDISLQQQQTLNRRNRLGASGYAGGCGLFREYVNVVCVVYLVGYSSIYGAFQCCVIAGIRSKRLC
jgi:hypothetical protein